MSNATKRAILRSIHLIFAIPILGYVYSPFAELPNYAPVVRFVSIPVLIFSGFWMYAGVFFAIIGVAVWLGAYYLIWIWGGYPESGRVIHRAEDLVGDPCATLEKIGPTRCCRIGPSTLL
jgi:predicted tellurium resistance membrane protein TerC